MGTPLWEATRANSQVKSWAFTMVGCGNCCDVKSAAPDTTTVASWNTSSAGTGILTFKAWSVPQNPPDANYLFGIRIACKSMGTAYLSFGYSVDSGANWTSLIASVGGTNLGATTLTRSLAGNFSVSSMLVRMNQTNAHSRGRAQLWDVFMVGSYTAPETFAREIPDPVGLTDIRGKWWEDTFSRSDAGSPGDPWVNWTAVSGTPWGVKSNMAYSVNPSSGGGGFFTGSIMHPIDAYAAIRVCSLVDDVTAGEDRFQLNLRGDNLAADDNTYFMYVHVSSSDWGAGALQLGARISGAETGTTVEIGTPVLPGTSFEFTIVGTGPVFLAGYMDGKIINAWAIDTPSMYMVGSLMGGLYMGGSCYLDGFEMGGYRPLPYALSQGAAILRSLYDDLGVSDAQFQAVTFARRMADALGVSDATAVVKALVRFLSEPVGAADSASRLASIVRRIADAVGVSYAAARYVLLSRAAAEALGLADAAAGAKILARILQEELGLTDYQVRAANLARILSEAPGISDSAGRTASWRRLLADTEGAQDSASRSASWSRTFSEVLGVADAAYVQRIIARAVADALGLSDEIVWLKISEAFVRSIAENLTIADSLSVLKFATILRAVSEAIGVEDAQATARAVYRILSEALGVADGKEETKQLVRMVSELAGLADDVERAAAIVRFLAEQAGVSDQELSGLAAMIVRSIADVVGLTDAASKLAALLVWLSVLTAAQIPAIGLSIFDPCVSLSVELGAGAAAGEEAISLWVAPPAIRLEVE